MHPELFLPLQCGPILIVVNMFLTGFDAIAQNTPWVDKNLKKYLGVV